MFGDNLKKFREAPFSTVIGAGLRVAHPSLLRVLMQDRAGRSGKIGQSQPSLDAAIKWLCRAQDACGRGGVSAGYSFVHGWHPPYPETTGYIIPTFYDYAHLTQKEEISERARRMADWELEVQLPSGAVQGSVYRGPGSERRPVVFNTGQVILGLCRAFAETGDQRYLDAARRAGDWLITAQSPDGAWRLSGPEVETQVHAYDSRTAWSLLEIDALTGDKRYADAARLNLDWTLAQQQENGWFNNNAFFTERSWNLPLTHTIAYVIEGLFESWRLTGEERYLNAARKTGEKLLRIFELRRRMAGEFDQNWKSSAGYSCLTGDAQIAGLWLNLFKVGGDTRFLNAALKLNDFVKASQSLRSLHPGVRGGVKGSQPIFGRYTPFTYVNWGAKFLADSLMLEERVMADFERAVRSGEQPSPYKAELRTASAVN
ncbi:MAG: beta-L-arabinofuranosidase domain-containing protein [Blastocatellales bacterium]